MAKKMNNVPTNNIGQTIKQGRLNQELTREKLAERAGISPRYLAAIENNERIPAFGVLCTLIRAVGVSADRIFYPEITAPNDDADVVLRLICLCDDNDREIVSAVIHALLQRKK